MRVVVISCYKYRDTWTPFLKLFEKFFGGDIDLLTDNTDGRVFPKWVHVEQPQGAWCQMLAQYAETQAQPVLLFQDDFFLNMYAQHDLIREAEEIQKEYNAGCVRLYPCPGGDLEIGHPHYAEVSPNGQYKISCQVALWAPKYLEQIARYAAHSPVHFEIMGRRHGRILKDRVFAFKREVEPWPVEYLCSAIGKGRWSQDAIKLCEREGIPIDLSLRPIAAA